MSFFTRRIRSVASTIVLASLLLLAGCESTTDPVSEVRLQLVGGGDQIGGAGTMLGLPVTVAVVDAAGRPVPRSDVTWRVVQGGGTTSAPLVATDTSGLASARWTLGRDVGTHLLVVQAGNTSLTVRATSEFRIVQIAAGFRHSCALSTAGELYCWGSNSAGQLGNGTGVSSVRPVRVPDAVGFGYVNAGWFHTCGVTLFDQMFCWGDDSNGQLGVGQQDPYEFRPERVTVIPTAVQISGGYVHTCGVENGGKLSCWGSNERSRLAASDGIASVAAGEFHSCAVRQDRQAVCWGWNSIGEVGTGAPFGAVITAPTPVQGSLLFSAVTASSRHTCALSSDGKVYCWGRSSSGEIGKDPFDHMSVPTAVEGAVGFTRVTTGNTHTCGIASGVAYCWGAWLGDGSSSTSRRPVAVKGLTGVTDIAAGFDHTCAVAGGEVWCWGSNLHGQLGQESIQQALVPVRVTFR